MDEEFNLKKGKDEIQVTIPLAHERKLQELLERINDGFEIARVTRKQVLAYIIDKVSAQFGDGDVQEVRQSVITDMTLLDLAYREIKKSGTIPEALREYLWKSSNLGQAVKRPKKTRQHGYSTAIPDDGEAA